MHTAWAPIANALMMSVPRRKPLSTRTGIRPPTASMISGKARRGRGTPQAAIDASTEELQRRSASRTIGVRSAQSLRPLRCGMMLPCPSRSDACRPSPEVDGGGRVLERTQNAI
jgi:hypothetical protein